jgi:hypothetical protein
MVNHNPKGFDGEVRRGGRKSMSSGGKTDFKVIVPTRAGIDLENNDKTIDGHIKIEKYSQQTNIYVDLFASKVKNADEAHITSESFVWSDGGANEATKFLQENGFRVVVMLK